MSKPERPKIDVEKIKERIMAYAEPLKLLIKAMTGKEDIRGRVDVLANPQNPKSMSILSPQRTKFCVNSYWASGVKEWGGIYNGLKDLADEVMDFSPSTLGTGREQVIRFVGALQESGLVKGLNITTEAGKKAAGENEK